MSHHPPTQILIATTNPGKLEEYQALLPDGALQFLDLAAVGLAGMDVEETGATFEENALLKATAYQKASGLITLADDSGIVVDALDGAPGVYSARYAPTVAERIAKLLGALRDVPMEKRTARFVCVIALRTPDGVTILTEGVCEGRVAFAPRGEHGHGYDPVFESFDNNGRTLAELPMAAKNRISHRGRALTKLDPLLKSVLGVVS